MITLTIFLCLYLVSTFGDTVDGDVVLLIFAVGGVETIIECCLACFLAAGKIHKRKQQKESDNV